MNECEKSHALPSRDSADEYNHFSVLLIYGIYSHVKCSTMDKNSQEREATNTLINNESKQIR